MTLQTRRMRCNAIMLSIQQQNNINHCKRKMMWVYPRPQFWFEQLVVNHYQDHLWREHFRVSGDTFEHFCGLGCPQLIRQNTILHQTITMEKRVAIALWRLATGNSYRTVGLTFGIGRCTAMNVKVFLVAAFSSEHWVPTLFKVFPLRVFCSRDVRRGERDVASTRIAVERHNYKLASCCIIRKYGGFIMCSYYEAKGAVESCGSRRS